jgi:succinoglycan biosynthesis protein ExoA
MPEGRESFARNDAGQRVIVADTPLDSMELPQSDDGSRLISVSIAIPTLNEEAHIKRVICSLQANRYPGIVEILVADGGSADRTVNIAAEIAGHDPRIKILRNPDKIQSAGLNVILAEASGDIFLRADAHNEYAEDYVEACVEALRRSGAVSAGGAQRFLATTPIQLGIALAANSVLGSGGAKYRNERYDGFADTVFMGCFWRKQLLSVGGFSTLHGPNEDAEMHVRLARAFAVDDGTRRASAGSAFRVGERSSTFISSRVRVWYYPRSTLPTLCRQYFRYGRGRCQTALSHGVRDSLRGSVPFLGLGVCSVSLGALTLLGRVTWAAFFCSGTLTCILVAAVLTSWRNRRKAPEEIWRGDPRMMPSLPARVWYCFLALLAMILSHSLGFACQMIRVGFRWRNHW